MPGTQPPKKWIGPRASSKQFQDLRLRSCDSNLCYSMQVASKNFQKPILYRKKAIYLQMLYGNTLKRPQLYVSVFLFQICLQLETLTHFSPLWRIQSPNLLNFAKLCDLSCKVGTLLHVWIPAISPPFLAIFSRNFSAYSRNFSAYSRNFSASGCIRIFSGCIFDFLRMYLQFLRLYFEFLRL